MPFLFLHAEYQPGIEVGEIGIETADIFVAAVAVASVLHFSVARLRAARWVWAGAAALLVWIAIATLYGELLHEAYPFLDAAVTAAKFAEYAVLAAAVPLLLRTRDEIELLIGVVVAWSVVMTLVGLLQFLGWVDEFEGRRPLQREPSYLGTEDFPAVSAAVLAVAFVVIALGTPELRARIAAGVAATTGVVGLVLGGALAGALATVLAAVGALVVSFRRGLLTARRAALVGALTTTVVAGVAVMRSAEIADYLAFLGIERADEAGDVETYSHRTLLAYIGVRIWQDDPILGVGWQGSSERYAYAPHLPDARERFPDLPPQAFPSPQHEWGVHNGYVQALADMGIPGLLALLAPLAAGLALAWWTATSDAGGAAGARSFALLGGLWLLVAVAVTNARGLVAGIPADALLWLALGLVAAAAARARGA